MHPRMMTMGEHDQRWDVQLGKGVDRDLKRFRSVMGELLRKLAVLEQNPDAGEELAGNLRGAYSLKFSLKGTGECRAAYLKLPDNRICLLFLVGPRENFYREAERRFEALQRRENHGLDDEPNLM